MTFTDMKVGVPYIVTKESDDGLFEVSDQITRRSDGTITKHKAEVRLCFEDLAHSVRGMQCVFDRDRVQRSWEKLQRFLADLETLDD